MTTPPSIEALGEKLGSDIYFVTHTWMGEEAHPDMPKFIELYKEMHGEPPDTSFVATGWDTIMLMAEAVKMAGSTDGAAVANGFGRRRIQASHRRPLPTRTRPMKGTRPTRRPFWSN